MIKFFLSFIFVLFIVLFFTQNSLIYYFEQRFHTDFGLEENLKGTIFSKGAAIFEAFCSFVDTSAQIIKTDNLASNSQNSNPLQLVEQTNHEAKNLNFIKVDKVNFIKEINSTKEVNFIKEQNLTENIAQNNATNNEIAAFNSIEKINITKQNEQNNTQTSMPKLNFIKDKIHLKSGDGVLFIGDSLMQYVGLNARKILPAKKLKATDLSKQSTGLIDRKGHNWHEVLKSALKADKNIKLVVVLIGANDVWGRAINGKFKDIFTQEWQEFYKTRVRDIYKISHEHGASVFWLSLPCMKKPDFEEKTALLNSIFSSISAEFGEFYLDTSAFMCENGAYQTHILENTKRIKIRQDDGIHMSKAGCAIIADEILKRIEIE